MTKTKGPNKYQGKRYHRPRAPSRVRGLLRALFSLFGATFLMIAALGLLVLISIALLYGYRLVTNSEYLALSEIEIQGNRHLEDSELIQLMDIETGTSILELNMSGLQQKLLSDPWIRDVNLRRSFPDQLEVKIREKQAYFWVQNNQQLYYADEKGRTIARVTQERPVSLPVLHWEEKPDPGNISQLVETMESRRFPFSIQDVAWVQISESKRAEIYIHGSDVKLSLRPGELDHQLDRLNAVWMDLRKRQELGAVNSITVAGENVWVEFDDIQQKE